MQWTHALRTYLEVFSFRLKTYPLVINYKVWGTADELAKAESYILFSLSRKFSEVPYGQSASTNEEPDIVATQ